MAEAWSQFNSWLESFLDTAGVDGVLYSRYVVKLLHKYTHTKEGSTNYNVDDKYVKAAIMELLGLSGFEKIQLETLVQQILDHFCNLPPSSSKETSQNESIDSGVCPSPDESSFQNYDEAFPPLFDTIEHPTLGLVHQKPLFISRKGEESAVAMVGSLPRTTNSSSSNTLPFTRHWADSAALAASSELLSRSYEVPYVQPHFLIAKCETPRGTNTPKIGSCPSRLEYGWHCPTGPSSYPRSADLEFLCHMASSTIRQHDTIHETSRDAPRFVIANMAPHQTAFNDYELPTNQQLPDMSGEDYPIPQIALSQYDNMSPFITPPEKHHIDMEQHWQFVQNDEDQHIPSLDQSGEDLVNVGDFCLPRVDEWLQSIVTYEPVVDLKQQRSPNKANNETQNTLRVPFSSSTHFVPIGSEEMPAAYELPKTDPTDEKMQHVKDAKQQRYSIEYHDGQEYYVLRESLSPGQLPLKFKAEKPEKICQTTTGVSPTPPHVFMDDFDGDFELGLDGNGNRHKLEDQPIQDDGWTYKNRSRVPLQAAHDVWSLTLADQMAHKQSLPSVSTEEDDQFENDEEDRLLQYVANIALLNPLEHN